MFEIRTITHPTADSQYPLIMIQTQHGVKYLIGNVSEGTQRIMTSNTIRMGKIKGVFLTGKLTWRKLAGLPGLILSVSDQGLKSMGLSYGNELLHYLVSSWRYFVFRKGMDLKCNVIDFEDGKCFEDELLKIRGFQVSDREIASINSTVSANSNKSFNEAKDAGFKESRSIIQVFLNKLISRMFPLDEPANIPNDKIEASEAELANYTKSDPNLNDSYVNTKLPKVPSINALNYSTNYLIEFHPVRGKFQKEKAIALGLKPGKIFAKLTNGESVTLENGTVITPEQVISPKRFFNKVLVLDIVSETNLRNLLQKFQPEAAAGSATIELDSFKDVNLIYYFLNSSIDPKGKLFDDLLSFFQNKLNVENHVISHKNYTANSLNFEQAAAHVFKLKLLQPDNYRLPLFHQSKYDVDSLKSSNELKEDPHKANDIGRVKSNENINENEKIQEDSEHQRSFNVFALDRNELFKVNHEMNISRESIDNFFTKNRELSSDEFVNKYWKQVYHEEVETLKLDNVIPVEYVNTLLSNQKKLLISEQNDELAKNNIQSQSQSESQSQEQRFPTENDIQELKNNVEIITLGTGSAIPSVKRNVISTIVRIPTLDSSATAATKTISHRAILLDAGENTIGSIKRIYNEQELCNFFTNELRLVYLSHLHADHHLGIVSIIEEWCKYQVQKNNSAIPNDNKNINDDTLYVIAPWQYDYFLDDLKSLEVVNQHLYLTDKIKFISCEDFLLGRKLPEKKQEDAFELLEKLDKVEMNNECEGPSESEMEADMEIANIEPENVSSSPSLSSLSSSSPSQLPSSKNGNENFYTASGSSSSSYQNYKDQAPRNHQLIDEIYKTLNINRILTCRAQHCRWSYCVTFDVSLLQDNNAIKLRQQQQTSFKFSYSGDTRPTMAFVKIGSQSDLLIHEATLEDELLEMAIAKSHSTTSEAVIVGKRMNVEKLILTHFSQRYPKLPDVNTIINNEKSIGNGNDSYDYRYNRNRGDQKVKARTMDVEFAFDGLMINYKHIGIRQKEILKDLDQIFSKEEESEKLHSTNLQQEEKSNREAKKKSGGKRKGSMKPNKKAKVSPPL